MTQAVHCILKILLGLLVVVNSCRLHVKCKGPKDTHKPIFTHVYFIYYCFKGKVSEACKRCAKGRLKGHYFVSAKSL